MKRGNIRAAMFIFTFTTTLGTLHAEYFKGGYPACVSQQILEEFLSVNNQERYVYITKNQCIYPKDASSIKLRSTTENGLAEVEFMIGSQRWLLWVPRLAVVRREQPHKRNLILSPDNPRSEDVCSLISNRTRHYNKNSDSVASSIVDVQSFRQRSDAKMQYLSGIANRSYELIVDWTDSQCVAELDYMEYVNLGCSLDVQKFNRCRNGATGANRPIDGSCYIDLCLKTVKVKNYP